MPSPDELLALIRDKVHHPATVRDLTRILKIPRQEAPAFKRQLKTLVAQGRLIQTRGNRFGIPDKMDLVVGRIQLNQGGFGFVVPESPIDLGTKPVRRSGSQDIYIAPPNLAEAMHGDRVLARIERHTEKGMEGRIVRILERAQE